MACGSLRASNERAQGLQRMGRRRLKTRNWKKAIVTLGPDDSIDFYEGA